MRPPAVDAEKSGAINNANIDTENRRAMQHVTGSALAANAVRNQATHGRTTPDSQIYFTGCPAAINARLRRRPVQSPLR
jgi:hypothetical protein